MKNLLTTVLLSAFLACLTNQKKISANVGKYEKSDEILYKESLPIGCDSSKTFKKKILFDVAHENLSKEELENYRLRIGWRGHIYFGKYSKEGMIVDLPFCDTNEMHILTFYLFDKSNKNIYIWSLKQNIYLGKYDTISVTLKADGDFKLN